MYRITQLALKHSAILITPNYRLLPEATGTDIISDLRSFYTWLHTSLPTHLSAYSLATADLSRVLVTGESSGGYLATQSALLFTNYSPDSGARFPQAVIAHYPMLDLMDAHYSEPGEKRFFNQPDPDVPPDYVDRQLAAIRPGTVVTERIPPDGEIDFFQALVMAGRFPEVLGKESLLYPMENLHVIADEGKTLPATWIFHGTADTVIPTRGTEAFVQELESLGLRASWELKVTYVEGRDHGFDKDGVTLDTDFVSDGLQWLSSHWP